MNDRLEELRSASTPYLRMEDDDDDQDSPAARSQSTGNVRLLEPFFDDLDVVKQNIREIEDVTAKIYDLATRTKMSATSETSKEISQQLSYYVAEGNRHAKASKELLEKLRMEPVKLPPGQAKIRTNMLATHTRKFVEVIKAYQAAQQHYKKEIKAKVKRQIHIVKPDATDEEVEFVMNGGDPADVIQAVIMQGNEAADPIKAAYAHATDKYQDVLLLESSVRDLHEMFMHFALLTERQGELLDNIEAQVHSTADLIVSGNEQLLEAVNIQKAVRKKQCILIVIVLVIIGVILVIVFADNKKK